MFKSKTTPHVALLGHCSVPALFSFSFSQDAPPEHRFVVAPTRSGMSVMGFVGVPSAANGVAVERRPL